MDDDLLLGAAYLVARQMDDDEDHRRKRRRDEERRRQDAGSSHAIEHARRTHRRRTIQAQLRREELDAIAIYGERTPLIGPDPRLTAEPQTISA